MRSRLSQNFSTTGFLIAALKSLTSAIICCTSLLALLLIDCDIFPAWLNASICTYSYVFIQSGWLSLACFWIPAVQKFRVLMACKWVKEKRALYSDSLLLVFLSGANNATGVESLWNSVGIIVFISTKLPLDIVNVVIVSWTTKEKIQAKSEYLQTTEPSFFIIVDLNSAERVKETLNEETESEEGETSTQSNLSCK